MKDNGGPAFPCQPLAMDGGACGPLDPGMTLRDWFAGMAMQGLLSGDVHARYSSMDWTEKLTLEAWQAADAMLEARKEGA